MPATDQPYLASAANIFVILFIMLGPLKVLGPFFQATREMEATAARALAWKVFGLSAASVLLAGPAGTFLLHNWQISDPVMQLAGGLIFLLVALQLVLAQYEPPVPAADTGVMHLVFPVTVTPYGVAAVIAMMALSATTSRALVVLGLALAVIALDLLAMLFVRRIMRSIGPIPLQILGAVLGVLQVALAMQFIVDALRDLGVV